MVRNDVDISICDLAVLNTMMAFEETSVTPFLGIPGIVIVNK